MNYAPKISEVITSLIELQSLIGDQKITLARWDIGHKPADIPLPYVPGLGVILHGGNGEVTRK